MLWRSPLHADVLVCSCIYSLTTGLVLCHQTCLDAAWERPTAQQQDPNMGHAPGAGRSAMNLIGT